MSELNSEVGVVIPGETAPNIEETNTPDIVAIAKEKGWRDRDSYEGNPETWVEAEEFVKRTPLLETIKFQKRKLKELEKTVEGMAKHYQVTIQQAKEKTIAELTEQRREAIKDGEIAFVEEIDKRISDVRAMEEPVVPQAALPPEIEDFIAKNEWFNKNQDMADFTITHNKQLLSKGIDLKTALAKTLDAVKRAYPEEFVNKRRENPSPVEGSQTPNDGANKKYSMNRLNPEQKLVYEQLVKKHGQLTHDQYFKSLDEAGFLN